MDEKKSEVRQQNGFHLSEKSTLPVLPPSSRSFLLARWVPYAELSRLHKPTGIYYFYFPFLHGSLLASAVNPTTIPPIEVLMSNLLFFALCAIWRGAACTWNDTLDVDLDKQVARTRNRPIARGAVSVRQAHIYTAVQTIVALGLASLLPARTLYAGIPWLALVILYPLAKRVTMYPQAILGFVMSWGSIWSCMTLSDQFLNFTSGPFIAMICLLCSNYVWAVLYDMIYAHQDVEDDKKAGVKSIAVVHQGDKHLLFALSAIQATLLRSCAVAVGAGWGMIAGVCVTALTLTNMIWSVDLGEPASCLWWFQNGCWFTGLAISSGFLGEYAARFLEA